MKSQMRDVVEPPQIILITSADSDALSFTLVKRSGKKLGPSGLDRVIGLQIISGRTTREPRKVLVSASLANYILIAIVTGTGDCDVIFYVMIARLRTERYDSKKRTIASLREKESMKSSSSGHYEAFEAF